MVGIIVATQQSQDKNENKTHFQAPQHKLSPVREVARAFETELHIIYYVTVAGDEVEVVFRLCLCHDYCSH